LDVKGHGYALGQKIGMSASGASLAFGILRCWEVKKKLSHWPRASDSPPGKKQYRESNARERSVLASRKYGRMGVKRPFR
jgi:hypothetical protein